MEIEKSREEQIVRWANYVRTHKDWKKHHTRFINAIFDKHDQFVKRLLKTPNGKEKLQQLMKK